MHDHSELAKRLAFAVDSAQKTSALIDEAVAKLLGLKSALDQSHPQLSGIHRAIVGASPDAPIPPPAEPVSKQDLVSEETE